MVQRHGLVLFRGRKVKFAVEMKFLIEIVGETWEK
jgi:hypothetical protein